MKKRILAALALSLLLPLSGCLNEKQAPPQKQEETTQSLTKQGPVVLYLPTEDGTDVLPKTIKLTYKRPTPCAS